LTANPRSKFMIDGAGRPVAIPQSLRGIQQDYAFVGGGYDTPSERSGRFPSAQGSVPTLPPQTPEGQRAAIETNGSSDGNQLDTDAGRPNRYLRGRLVDGSGRTVFETGAPRVPFVPSGPLAAQAPDLNQPPPSSSGSAPAGSQYGGNNAWPAGANGSGQALPIYPLPPTLGGADPSPSNADMNDWYARWVNSLQQN
jgi:hypothetical protein